MRVPSNTWWTTLAGTALHEVTAVVDLNAHMGLPLTTDEAMNLLPQALEDAILDQQVRYPNDTIKASGRVTKETGWSGSPTKKDRDWVEMFLPVMLQQYMQWREETRWEVAEFDGEPAVELGIKVDLTDPDTGESFPIIGSIDRVFDVPFRGLFVVDVKSGAVPASFIQLATYGAGVELMHGVTPKWGAYWQPNAKGGGLTEQRIDLWDADTLTRTFLTARRGMNEGIYLPNVTNLCKGCGVRDYCWGYSGSKATKRLDELNASRKITTLSEGSVPSHAESE